LDTDTPVVRRSGSGKSPTAVIGKCARCFFATSVRVAWRTAPGASLLLSTVIVKLALPPAGSVSVAGTETVRSGGAVTVSVHTLSFASVLTAVRWTPTFAGAGPGR